MNRDSKDILDPEGFILSGYDYQLQVWVKNGQIEVVVQFQFNKPTIPSNSQT